MWQKSFQNIVSIRNSFTSEIGLTTLDIRHPRWRDTVRVHYRIIVDRPLRMEREAIRTKETSRHSRWTFATWSGFSPFARGSTGVDQFCMFGVSLDIFRFGLFDTGNLFTERLELLSTILVDLARSSYR